MAGAPYLSALFPDHSRFYRQRNRASNHCASDKKVRNLSSRCGEFLQAGLHAYPGAPMERYAHALPLPTSVDRALSLEPKRSSHAPFLLASEVTHQQPIMCERIPIAGDRGRHAIDVVIKIGQYRRPATRADPTALVPQAVPSSAPLPLPLLITLPSRRCRPEPFLPDGAPSRNSYRGANGNRQCSRS